MRCCLALMITVAAGVLGVAPREAAAYPLGILEAERLGLWGLSDEPQPEVASSSAKPLGRAGDGRKAEDGGDGNEPVPHGLVALGDGTMQPSNADGSGTGASSPDGLASAMSCLVTVPSLAGQIVESRLLIPIRFLDGVFRPPRPVVSL